MRKLAENVRLRWPEASPACQTSPPADSIAARIAVQQRKRFSPGAYRSLLASNFSDLRNALGVGRRKAFWRWIITKPASPPIVARQPWAVHATIAPTRGRHPVIKNVARIGRETQNHRNVPGVAKAARCLVGRFK